MKITPLLMAVLIVGCTGPLSYLPGGRLAGSETALVPSAMPKESGVLQIETRPDDPYSVNVGFALFDGTIDIDPAPSRTWYQYLNADPRVRIRFDGRNEVHPARAVDEEDAAIRARFDPDRIVMRLEAR